MGTNKEVLMGWQRSSPVEQRLHFISDALRKTIDFSALCRLYTISRKTGYKWLRRFQALGDNGLNEQSRKPHVMPYAIPYRIKDEIIMLRKKHNWGPKKLLVLIANQHPSWPLPSRSTVHTVLKRAGLTKPQRKRYRIAPATQPLAHAHKPNVVWTADFKGQFRLLNGIYCYPLTIADACSRLLFACQGMKGTTLEETRAVFTRVFKEYGLPERIRTDNGVPFATQSAGGLSRLSVWWIHLGIYPERIRPGHPQENGRHERMHRTLKSAVTNPPEKNFESQQKAFDAFRETYNQERPHEALGMKTPCSQHRKSNRPFPAQLPAVEYPPHYTRRLVNYNGCIVWKNIYVYVSYLLHGEYVGLNQINEDTFEVYFGPIKLGFFHQNMLDKTKSNRLYINLIV
jgi:putative transposase